MKHGKVFCKHAAQHLFVAAALFSLGLPLPVDACQFWGALGNPSIQSLGEPLYEAQVDWLHTRAQSNPVCGDGWTVMAWNNFVSRYNRDNDLWVQTEYHTECTNAWNAAPPCIFVHARTSTNHNEQINPHPFIYQMYMKDYALMHNGNVWPSTTYALRVEDSLGMGFIALDQFYNRRHTHWNAGWRIDSEYYTMMMMKYFMAGTNYYWPEQDPAPPAYLSEPEEWAIWQTTKKLVAASPSYTSLNAALSQGTKSWLIFRVNDNDEHCVSYYPQVETTDPNNRIFSTTTRTDAGWYGLTTTDHGTYGCWATLQPNQTNELSQITDIGLMLPEQLRINEQGANSTGNQKAPAIAANPYNGQFYVVWESSNGNAIKGRLYNQMGLSEEVEQTFGFSDNSLQRHTPACAFSRNPYPDTLLVVWAARPQGAARDTEIRMQRIVFDPTFGQMWEIFSTVINVPAADIEVRNPTVTASDNGWLITWERRKASTTTIQYWQVWGRMFNPGGGFTERVLASQNGYDYTKPDVTFLGNGRYVVAVHYMRSGYIWAQKIRVILVDEPSTVGTPLSALDDANYSRHSIERLTASRFVLGFFWGYSDDGIPYRVGASVFDVAGGSISRVHTVTGEDIAGGKRTDVAALSSTVFYLSYETYGTLNSDIHVARCTTGSTTPLATETVTEPAAVYDQMNARMAIATVYRTGSDAAFYSTHSGDGSPFQNRRMIVWETTGEDYPTEPTGCGIAGQFKGIRSDYSTASWHARDRYNENALKKGITALVAQGGGSDGDVLLDPESASKLSATTAPTSYRLFDAYPNPFNPTTHIRYDVPEAVEVRLDVFDIVGRRVTTLVNGMANAGSYTVSFDGSALPSGTYFVRMQAGTFADLKKILLVK